MGRYPDYFSYIYKALIVFSLIGWRHVNYRYNIYHYFLIDFWYIGNYIIFFMLFVCPNNRFLYIASFAFGWGTLGWATVLVNNSFVLHSIPNQSTLKSINICCFSFLQLISIEKSCALNPSCWINLCAFKRL